MKFNSTIFERGRKYLQQGKVRNIVHTEDNYEADVMGSSLYHVSAALKNGNVLSMECDCPYAHSGNNCKHEAALYIHILNEAKQKKTNDKKSTKKPIKKEVESIYQNTISSYKGNQQRAKIFAQELDALFEREKSEALKKFDKDVFNRWFDYVDKANLYVNQNFWHRSDWMNGFSTSVKELTRKNTSYKKIFIQVLASMDTQNYCFALERFFKEFVESLNSEDALYYETERLKQIEDKEIANDELFKILLDANQGGTEKYLKYLNAFKEFQTYESYQYLLIVTSQEEQAKKYYEEYKKSFGSNKELEALVYKEETKKRAFYTDLAFHMEYKNRDMVSLSNLIKIYGNQWIDYCEDFYQYLKTRLQKKQVDYIVSSVEDFQYMALQMMKFKGTRLNDEYMRVIFEKDKDLYKHIRLQNFIRAIGKADKHSYYWFDNAYRDFYYSSSEYDILEALSYAKQYFRGNDVVIKEIDNQLRRYL
ncbi:MAG: hypothetical protein KBT48_00070 [Firmicutes bacterium]|nr:hypothetical protein [Bacillota bacterium]